MKVENFYSQFFRPGIVSTDSRKIIPGDIFIALKGDNFNGELFAESAIRQGASVVVASKDCRIKDEKIIYVNDTLIFLQQLARYHREFRNIQVIALTGSNGKTTTKELLRSVLSQKYVVQSTHGNLNNHIGVPLTLLSIVPETQIAIVEMGANHPGEIKLLCEIALPQSGLITNIGKAHLEGFGSYEGVKKAKAELFDFLKHIHGKIYYNGADDILIDLVGKYPNKIAYNSPAGICSGRIISANPSLSLEITNTLQDSLLISSSLFGQYNLNNMVAAAGIGLDLGLNLAEIKKGIENYTPDGLRSQLISIGSTQLILDCYNANPTSMRLALQSFSEYPNKRKIVILGGMRELGIYEKEEHWELARYIQKYNFDSVLFFGSEFDGIRLSNSTYFKTLTELKDYIKNTNLNNVALLIKGSRANRLEEIVEIMRNK
jgi:UDP-N-acetylmuramoyl-tripeptide--D-alanyl-D-alanine ligase